MEKNTKLLNIYLNKAKGETPNSNWIARPLQSYCYDMIAVNNVDIIYYT